MTDLETEIRAALAARADAITPADLRGTAGARRPRRTLWPLLAAAAVAVLAVGTALLLTRDGGSNSPSGSSSPSTAAVMRSLDGRVMCIREVTTSAGTFTYTPPPSGSPYISIDNNAISVSEGDQFTSGTFHVTGAGFRVSDVTGTANGSVTRDRAVLARFAAEGAVLSGDEVGITRSGDGVTLRVGSNAMRLEVCGSLSRASSVVPSATAHS